MDAKAVGQRIRAARERKHLTQEELAALVDISPTHVSVIERGTKIPRMDTFVAIANVLEVSARTACWWTWWTGRPAGWPVSFRMPLIPCRGRKSSGC